MDLKDRQSNVMFMVFLNDEMRTEWRQTILIFSPPHWIFNQFNLHTKKQKQKTEINVE